MKNKKKYQHDKGNLVHGILFISLMAIISVSGYAQMGILGGTTVRVSNGTTLQSAQDLVLKPGGNLDVPGTLVLKRNLLNQNPTANSLGTGTMIFSGTVSQTISGWSVIQDLQVNNPSGLSLAGHTTVNGLLTLTSGRMILATGNLLLGPSATIAGTFSPANMIVATGSGALRKEFSAPGTFLFPVGDDTGEAEYSPVTLSFLTGTFSPGNYAGVTLSDEPYPGADGNYLSRYWSISRSGISDFSCNVAFQYVPADVNGNEADIFCTRVDPTPAITYDPANIFLRTIEASGLAGFGIFTGNTGNAAEPPSIRSLQDHLIEAGSGTCSDALQSLLIAGNGTFYLVQNGGSAIHIAGQKISYFPGTKVEAGGYLHGYISDIFCNPPDNPDLTPLATAPEAMRAGGGALFTLYPNPTSGSFTLCRKEGFSDSGTRIEIFGFPGRTVFSGQISPLPLQEFSLRDQPPGLYLVRVTDARGTGMKKIIKY